MNYINPKNTQILAEYKMIFLEQSTGLFPQQLGREVKQKNHSRF